jgi:hypothetical protein
MRRLLLAFLLTTPVLPVSGCFNYDEPSCSFKCGGGTECPDDYECHSDGYCHLANTTDVCAYSDAAQMNDLSAASSTDMSDAAVSFQDQDLGDAGGTD